MTTQTPEPRPVVTRRAARDTSAVASWWSRVQAPAFGALWRHLRLLWADARAAPYRSAVVVAGTLLGVAALRDAAGAVVAAYETGNPVLAPLELVGALLVSLLGYSLVAALGLLLVDAGAYLLAALHSVGWTYYSRHRRARFRRGLATTGTVVLALLVLIFARIGLGELLASAVVLGLLAWLTRRRRAVARRRRWLLQHIARAAGERVDDQPRAWRVEADAWDERGALVEALVWYPPAIASSDPNRRAAMERAVTWALRDFADVEYTVRWEPGRTALRITAQPPLPDYVGDRIWPRLRGGIVVGVCGHDEADAIVRGTELGDLGVRLWRPDDERDLLIAGVKGSGKTVLGRGIAVRGLRDGWFPGGVWILDGKSGGDYAALDGRDGIEVVARIPDEWAAALRHLVDRIMRPRYDETYEYQRGNRSKPDHPRVLALLDEVQNIRTHLGEEAMAPLDALARMARAANVSLVVLTQRPDAADAIPGAIRDQLEDRAAVGWLSRDGGRMVLDDDWHAVVVDPDRPVERPRGRAVVRIAGRLSIVQIPDLPSPVDRPEAEPLYPLRTSASPEPGNGREVPRQRAGRDTNEWRDINESGSTPIAGDRPEAKGPEAKETDSGRPTQRSRRRTQ